MSNILDQLFRLTPVNPEEPASVTNVDESNTDTVVSAQPEGNDTVAGAAQGESPEDTHTGEQWQMLSDELREARAELDALKTQAAQHQQALERFVKLSPMPAPDAAKQEKPPAKLAADDPEPFVPLEHMDFVTRDGKF